MSTPHGKKKYLFISFKFNKKKMEGHQRSCVFLIDHVAERFQHVCNFKNFSNLSLISIVHSLLFYESHCIPFAIFMFYSQTRDKTRFRVQILIFVSYLYSSFILKVFLRITFQTLFVFYIRFSEKERNKRQKTAPPSNTFQVRKIRTLVAVQGLHILYIALWSEG